MGLYDAVLIKDNHLDGTGLSPADAVRRAREAAPQAAFIEIEVRSLAELRTVLPAEPDIVMPDNFTLPELREAVELVRRWRSERGKSRPLVEASGGITMQNLLATAQTGIDRISIGALTHSAASLDLAIEIGLPHGGWICRGRKTEDGPLSTRYHLKELDSGRYRDRTEKNVLDSDGTVIFSFGPLQGGSALTEALAIRHDRPCLFLNLAEISQEQATDAMNRNISALAIIAHYFPGSWATISGIIINIFAVVTSFFGVFLAFQEACKGLLMNVLLRKYKESEINQGLINKLVTLFIILLAWGVIATNFPILKLTSICSPIFGLVGCLIPAYLVYKVHPQPLLGAARH